jgi:YegS/Rv2252/BmrU family lipid kinase
MNDFFIFVNPFAGNGKPLKILPVVERILKKKSKKVESYILKIKDDKEYVKKALMQALSNKIRNFICLGGDGTLNILIQELVKEEGITVGILPVGSGNDMARALGFSSSFSENEIEKLVEGERKFIDIGICNGRYFCNSLGIGFDAKVASDYNRSPFLKGKAKYLFQIFKNILFYNSENMEIPGFLERQKVFLISIGNGKSSGGGVPLTKEAKLDDGMLDVCIIKEANILQRIQNLAKGLKGKHLDLPFVKYFKTKALKIITEEEVTFHIDGEIFKGKIFDVSILPKKLKVIFSKN